MKMDFFQPFLKCAGFLFQFCYDREFAEHLFTMRGVDHHQSQVETGKMTAGVVAIYPQTALGNIIDFSFKSHISRLAGFPVKFF